MIAISITVRDVMRLPCMNNAEIVAGKNGIDNIVTGVSVLEYSEPPQAPEKMFFDREYLGSEIVITSFASVGDEVDKQYAEIQNLSATGAVGIVLYYMALFVKRLDNRIIQLANELGFVIIVMPPAHYHLRYLESITCIQNAILLDRLKTINFAPEVFNTLSSLPQSQQSMNTFLRILSDYLQVTLVLTDQSMHILSFAAWPSMLEREIYILLNKVLHHGNFAESGISKEMNNYMLKLHRPPKIPRNLIIMAGGKTIADETLKLITGAFESFWEIIDVSDDNRRGARALIQSIIGDEPVRMRKQARFLGINENRLHNILLFRQASMKLENISTIVGVFREELNKNCKDFVVDNYSGDVVVLLDDDISKRWLVTINEIKHSLNVKNIKGWLLYACNLKTTREIREAYYACVDNIQSALRIYPCADILSLHEILFAKNCRDSIDRGETYIRAKMHILDTLDENDSKLEREILETLSVFYFDAHMKTSVTAKLMFLHHNTVKYRLRKVSQRLGSGITDMPEMQELYTALAFRRLLGE